MTPRPTFRCPHCDAPVPVGALVCRECGSDADSGWAADAAAFSGDPPVGYDDDGMDDADYEDFLRDEGLLVDGKTSRRAARRRGVLLITLLLIACLLVWLAR